MTRPLPPESFRDAYQWRGGSLVGAAASAPAFASLRRPSSRLPFNADGRVHPMRARFEFYPTPPQGTRALLSVEDFDGPIWEPACGEGHIADVLVKAGYEVVSTDLIPRGYGEGDVDFLRQTEPRAKHIVTNPPYGRGLGDAFVLKALELTAKTGGKVAMLLNLASLCHPTRHEFWNRNQPAALYGLDELVCWPEGRPELARATTASHRYVWAVWKPDHVGPTTFGWVKASAL
jgi:predicted RNA methylase